MCLRGQNLIGRINNFPMGHCTIGESLFCLMIQRIDANLVMVNILSTESKSTGSHPQKS